jgi:hypothetical protein
MLASIQPASRAIILMVIWGLLMATSVHADDSVLPSQTALAKADWSVKASPNLAKQPPSLETVEAFVLALETSVLGESLLGDDTEICSFRFADLRHDGSLSLVYGEDTIDRPSTCAVHVVDKTRSGFELYSGAEGELEKVEDLGKDGKIELVLDTGSGSIQGQCHASWMAIYAWSGTSYNNVSDQFKDLYRQRLDAITKALANPGRVAGSDDHSVNDKECLMAEAAAIQRFLGISTDAGIDQALRLTKSPNRTERQFGTELLQQIGSPIARKNLEVLAKDPDYGVASYARSGGSSSSHGYRYAPAAFRQLP